jgi:hypothetical protein
MKSTILNKQEFEELERRWFFAKKNFEFKDLLKSVLNIILYLSLFLIASTFVLWVILLIFFPPWAENISIWSYIGIWITFIYIFSLWVLPILNFIFSFFKSGISLYSENWMIEYWKVNWNKSKILFLINKLVNNFLMETGGWWAWWLAVLWIICWILFIMNEWIFAFLVLVSLSFFTLFLLLWQRIYQLFNPIYAFWNLWEKIQNLTPQIESQSHLIQREFKKDMNFAVFHSGFEKLSSTFSEIVSLVLKLERVEERANKWNLFDSEKYINSLRTDIVNPLLVLKGFLEDQKIELLKSQRELMQVRVWWGDTWANIALTSKRSESLIAELDTNIESLETMIQKMWG